MFESYQLQLHVRMCDIIPYIIICVPFMLAVGQT